jgi:hypothetical protein
MSKQCNKCNRSDVRFYTVTNRCGRQKGQTITRLTCTGCESKARYERKISNKEKLKADTKKYYDKNKIEIQKRRTETRKKLPDGYIIRSLNNKEASSDLIEAKRLLMQLKIKINEKTKGVSNARGFSRQI